MNKDEICRLKGALRIEEVAGRYMALRRTGRLWTGLCPFHGDRHPSFVVNPEKQTYTCYACGERGDVFAFVQKMEHCSFGEAVEKLAGSVPALDAGSHENCPLTSHSDTAGASAVPHQVREQAVPSPLERGQGVCKAVCKTECKEVPPLTGLLNLLQPCASGHSELSGTWLDFEVGHAPYLVPSQWKAMRNRLVFPIRNEAGELVAFAARRLSDTEAEAHAKTATDSPKYINSASSELYHKSELLYGLYRAGESIRQVGHVFLVEGYKDVLAMHAAGFTQTVALCGTALCPGHIALLRKYTSQVYLLLDGDKAGRAASARAASQLREADMESAICRLPDGEDPDSLFRRLGKADFRTHVEGLRSEVSPSEEVLMLRRIRRGIDSLSALSDPLERRPLLSLLAGCISQLTALSHQAGRPATMDWRWV